MKRIQSLSEEFSNFWDLQFQWCVDIITQEINPSLKPFITLRRCSHLLQRKLIVWYNQENAGNEIRSYHFKSCFCHFLVMWLEQVSHLSGYSLSMSVLIYLIVITMPYLQGHVKTTWNASLETQHNYCARVSTQ